MQPICYIDLVRINIYEYTKQWRRLWKNQNLTCPNSISFTIDDITKNFNKCIDDIELFTKTRNPYR